MKKLLALTAVCVTVLLVVAPLAHSQDKAAPPSQTAEKVFQGQLTKVDAEAKSIMVKGTGNVEMTFEYTDATQVLGPERNVQGLAGKTGTELKITYRDTAGKHTATRIETIEKQ